MPQVSLSNFKGRYVVLLLVNLATNFDQIVEIEAAVRTLGEVAMVVCGQESKFVFHHWLEMKAVEVGCLYLSDLNREISMRYHCPVEDGCSGLFIIDDIGVLRHAEVTSYWGRFNPENLLSVYKQLRHADLHGDFSKARLEAILGD